MRTVAGAPADLLAVTGATAGPDAAVAAAATLLAGTGLGGAVALHAERARALAEAARATGLALLAAGGAPGHAVLAAALATGGGPAALDPWTAARLLAAGLGLDAGSTSVERPAVDPAVVVALVSAVGAETVAAVAGWWPRLVGPVDGMPPALRYAANRTIALDGVTAAEAAGDHDRAAALLALASPGRQLLYVDPDRGHAAEVVGELHGASHVAVVVPGMGNRIEAFGTVLDKAEALRAAAAAAGASLVTIAWLGYDSPGVDAVLDDAALAAGPHLVRLCDALAGSPVVTVVGHSYGSVVAGEALRAGLDVDAVVVTGSPGMGAERATELGPVPVYALSAPGDVVSATQHFGEDPADPAFGATVLDTGGATGHQQYFVPGSAAVAAIALVAAGRAGEARRAPPPPLRWLVAPAVAAHGLASAPVDAVQGVARAVAAGASTAAEVLPGGGGHARRALGTAYEVVDGLVDFGQRLGSPELLGEAVEAMRG